MHSLARGFFAQIHVIEALIIRETRTRFGRHSMGYIWAFAEPLLWIGTFLLVFQLGRRNIPNGMDAIGFLATGLLPFILFRATVSRTMGAINANKALLYYPQVRPLDLVMARGILEWATLSLVFLILLLINTIYLEHLPLENSLKIITGLMMSGVLAGSFGLVLGSLATMAPAIENLVSPLLRPLLWVSGVFFTAAELPSNVRNVLIWNPLLQIAEMVRDGWFRSFDSDYYNYGYLACWLLAMAFFALTLERVARRNLEV
jgi:capsular polysaccharide transport system permease protein